MSPAGTVIYETDPGVAVPSTSDEAEGEMSRRMDEIEAEIAVQQQATEQIVAEREAIERLEEQMRAAAIQYEEEQLEKENHPPPPPPPN